MGYCARGIVLDSMRTEIGAFRPQRLPTMKRIRNIKKRGWLMPHITKYERYRSQQMGGGLESNGITKEPNLEEGDDAGSNRSKAQIEQDVVDSLNTSQDASCYHPTREVSSRHARKWDVV